MLSAIHLRTGLAPWRSFFDNTRLSNSFVGALMDE
jgi:hypothetical protein